jgi:DNA-binding CsgD family transcriptional regulator
MSVNMSYKHPRSAQRKAAHQLQSEIIVWALGAVLLVLLIGTISR